MSYQKTVTSFVLLLAVLLQASCSSVQQQAQLDAAAEKESEYCDNFMIYDMCAVDVDRSGVVDMIYFQDTNEVFMVNPNSDKALWAALPNHQCIQAMDGNMQSASNDLLTITDETGMLEKTKMKSRLMLSYAKYMPKVNRCNNSGVDLAVEDSFGEDSFGEEDFDEL